MPDLGEREEDWRELALCAQVDPTIFHPDRGGSARPAKLVCLACDARIPCLQEALDTDDRWGVRGGYSERERRRLKRGQVVALPQPRKAASPKHCVTCGGEFFGSSNAMYCGKQCRSKAQMDRYRQRKRRARRVLREKGDAA